MFIFFQAMKKRWDGNVGGGGWMGGCGWGGLQLDRCRVGETDEAISPLCGETEEAGRPSSRPPFNDTGATRSRCHLHGTGGEGGGQAGWGWGGLGLGLGGFPPLSSIQVDDGATLKKRDSNELGER